MWTSVFCGVDDSPGVGACSPAPTSPGEAVGLLVGAVRAVEAERVAIGMGRVLAEDCRLDRDSPGVDVSSMDGYAMRLADVRAGERVVRGECLVGREPTVLHEGTCVKIVTGAPIPRGAEVVIPRERVEEFPGSIRIAEGTIAGVKNGQFIRRRGENARAGAVIARAGDTITPPIAAVLAAAGVTRPSVRRRVRVGVLATGDEVLDPEWAPSSYQVRDSNTASLRAIVESWAWCECLEPVRAADDPAAIRRAMEELLRCADMLLVTGGVSMGDHDHVPGVVREVGARVLFHRLPVRPGRPVLGAVTGDARPILALPGNPVSVMVTARRLGVPLLRALAACSPGTPARRVTLANPDGKTLDLWWHRPCVLLDAHRAELVATTGSGDVVGAARSHGFVEIPPGHDGTGAYEFYSWIGG